MVTPQKRFDPCTHYAAQVIHPAANTIPDKVRAANPATYVRKDAPPFLIQHGAKDPIVPVQQSIGLAERLREVCGDERVILDMIEGAEHGDPKFETRENVEKVLNFLDQHLK
jgi:dipeptidyl aminopeptidase/acylaminoacyl peptidase